MKALYCIICGKYRKFKNLKISYIFERTLALSVICSKYRYKDQKQFKKEESIAILKILGFFKSILLL